MDLFAINDEYNLLGYDTSNLIDTISSARRTCQLLRVRGRSHGSTYREV